MTNSFQFLSGAAAFGCFIAATFFFKFRMKTGEALFDAFAWGFVILGIERLLLVLDHAQKPERHPLIYIVRLFAFLVILNGILQKNRQST